MWASPPPPTRFVVTMEKEWWKDPLADDIHHNLRQKEATLPAYFARSPQLCVRRYLVDWLAVLCEKFELCTTARHLTVTLLDFFMDKFNIEEPQLKLVALGSLLVASKFEEHDLKVPKWHELNCHVPSPGYEAIQYLQIELVLLEFFQWNISFPTPAHFIDYFLCASISACDQHGDLPLADSSRARTYMSKYSNYFLEISMQDHHYRDFKPSQIAAASIGASRLCLQLTPGWPASLSERTSYSWQDVLPLVQKMLKTHQMDEQAAQRKKELTPESTPTTAPASPDSTPGLPRYGEELLGSVYYTPSSCYHGNYCVGLVGRIS